MENSERQAFDRAQMDGFLKYLKEVRGYSEKTVALSAADRFFRA